MKHIALLLLMASTLAASHPSKGWFYEQWARLEQAKQFNEAVPLFSRSIEIYPREAWFHVFLGISYVNLGRHEEGIPHLLEAVRIEPGNARIRANLDAGRRGRYYRRWREMEKAGRFSGAIPLYAQAVEEYPREAWFHVYLGLAQVKAGQTGPGLAHLENAVRLAPGNREIRANLVWSLQNAGNRLSEQGDLEGALRVHRRAVEALPGNAWAQNLFALSLTRAGRFLPAFRAFGKAAEAAGAAEWKEPNFTGNLRWGVLHGSKSLAALGKPREAVSYAEFGVKVLPGDWEVALHLITIYKSTGSREAVRMRRAVGGIPNERHRQLLLAAVAMIGGNRKAGESSLREIGAKHPDDPQVWSQIADVYSALTAGLDYDAKMKSADQRKSLQYGTRAVEAYFRKRPFRQARRYIPPLREKFCVLRGAGGISFHNGLKGHFSYDLGRCGKDSTGMEVVAVADGTVLETAANEPDRTAGAPVDLSAGSNYVLVDHGNTRSLYNHLRRNSVRVRVGEKVKAGEKIALVGNSGVTSGPHLHFSLTNAQGITLPIRFSQLSRGKRAGAARATGPAGRLEEGYSYLPQSPR